MKNTLKICAIAACISVSLAACKGNGSAGSGDSSKKDSAKVDSSSSMKSKTDTTLKLDTVKPATDTSKAKVDTVGKTVTKSTEVKKTAVKKN